VRIHLRSCAQLEAPCGIHRARGSGALVASGSRANLELMRVQPDRLSRVAHAIADPTRRSILRASSHREQRVLDLARLHPGMTLAAISKHIQVLARAGLIQKRRDGREVYCSADLRPLELLERFPTRYARFWNERLDALAHHLDARP